MLSERTIGLKDESAEIMRPVKINAEMMAQMTKSARMGHK